MFNLAKLVSLIIYFAQENIYKLQKEKIFTNRNYLNLDLNFSGRN
jgi:hypothetical protein